MTTDNFKKKIETLSNAFLFLDNENEIFYFLNNLFSESELLDIQQRLDIAVRLYYGIPYTKIEEELGASSTTIAKVSKEMKKKNNGYMTVIHRMYSESD